MRLRERNPISAVDGNLDGQDRSRFKSGRNRTEGSIKRQADDGKPLPVSHEAIRRL